MYICVIKYVCAFFCSWCSMHFGTGVLGTSAWAGVYVTKVCFCTNVHICDTLAAGCVHMCICVYACICIWMRMCVYDIACCVKALLLRFSICAYVCKCVRMYMRVHVCVYRCRYICMYMYMCMSVYMYSHTVIYTCVWVYICTRVGAFCLFVLSNVSATCACITGVS